MHTRTEILYKIKYGLVRLIALLFVIYALADVSILQAYCGNESAGIPPAHHYSQKIGDPFKSISSVSEKNQTELRDQSSQGNQSPHEWDDETCFCCCSHVLAAYFSVTLTINTSAASETRPDTYESRYSNSTLSNFFRPPRTA